MPNNPPVNIEPAKSISTKTPRKGKAKYLVDERERMVKTYPFSTSEIVTLSVLNPAAAALIGWGVNVLLTWLEMPGNTKESKIVGVSAFGLIAAGAVLQIVAWGLFWMVRKECQYSDE